ncbi:DNA polymerase Y family protein, partial [Acidobacteriota bacterium]
GEVSKQEIDQAVAAVAHRLRYFTPYVEPSVDEAGVYWLDASGLDLLHGSLHQWAGLIRSNLGEADLKASVVVGFSRFGTYAMAKGKGGIIVLGTREEEKRLARQIPLELLAMNAGESEVLHKLKVRTVGAFIDLPAQGTHRRFGPVVHRLHRMASGSLEVPFHPERPEPPVTGSLSLDDPETDLTRLMLIFERLLHPMIAILAQRKEALTVLQIRMKFDNRGKRIETLMPAEPTLDAKQILDLVELRMQHVNELPDGIVKIILKAQGAKTTQGQMSLFAEKSRRDFSAANLALARIRAELGNGAVKKARLQEGHLPEATFTWENLDTMKTPKPGRIDNGAMVRRLYPKPVPLPYRPRREPDGRMLLGIGKGRAVDDTGPFVISGGWWRKSIHREYHYVETDKGELLWVYYDRIRRRWFLQGRVE